MLFHVIFMGKICSMLILKKGDLDIVRNEPEKGTKINSERADSVTA